MTTSVKSPGEVAIDVMRCSYDDSATSLHGPVNESMLVSPQSLSRKIWRLLSLPPKMATEVKRGWQLTLSVNQSWKNAFIWAFDCLILCQSEKSSKVEFLGSRVHKNNIAERVDVVVVTSVLTVVVLLIVGVVIVVVLIVSISWRLFSTDMAIMPAMHVAVNITNQTRIL